ncbi:MAG: hypothetical protein ABII25_07395 [bacterium]
MKKNRSKLTSFLIVAGIGILAAIVSGGLSYWIGIYRGHLFFTTLSGLISGFIFGIFYGVYYIMER